MATTAYGKTGGTLAPIEIGNKPYGGGTPIGPKATLPRRFNREDQNIKEDLNRKIATARMARGGAGSATGKNRSLIGLKGSYRP